MRNDLFDEAARILAAPVRRRQAFGLLWKILAGTVLAGAVATPASAQIPGQGTCNTAADCPTISGSPQKCCPAFSGAPSFCAPKDWTCCGKVACRPNQRCVASDTGDCAP